ncbi:MAG: SH3 domain-containing protein [Oscillospiraceae bacterium]|nr:SH3 domain-containing protein [Oscillospiraceae bacterium]
MFGQNTIYFQKFDVNPERGGQLFWHQYMQNVLAPFSESRILYNAYSSLGLLNNPIHLIIPIYENMPEIKQESPNINPADFVPDNTKVSPTTSGNLNIRVGPGTSYETLATVTRNDVLTRISKGRQAGDQWDRVILPSGKIGYAFQSFLEASPEVEEVEIESINLSLDRTTINRGENETLNIEILPEEARENRLVFTSSNTNIAVVTNSRRNNRNKLRNSNHNSKL